MTASILHIIRDDGPYILIATVLLLIAGLLARATERQLHAVSSLDDAGVGCMNKVRSLAILAAIVLLIIGWRLSVPLALVGFIATFVIAYRKSAITTATEDQSLAETAMYQPKVPRPIVTRAEYEPRELEFSIMNAFAKHGQAAIINPEVREEIGPIFLVYEFGIYEEALRELTALVSRVPAAEVVLWPYLEICRRVVDNGVRAEDRAMHAKMQKWYQARRHHWHWWTKLWVAPTPRYIRCKYCARYRDLHMENMLVAPETCWYCRRKYPLPSAAWDSVPGQAYMFYRRSVSTKSDMAFYQAFVERFDVREFNDDRFAGTLRLRLPERYKSWLDEKTFAEHYSAEDQGATPESGRALMSRETYLKGYVTRPDM